MAGEHHAAAGQLLGPLCQLSSIPVTHAPSGYVQHITLLQGGQKEKRMCSATLSLTQCMGGESSHMGGKL